MYHNIFYDTFMEIRNNMCAKTWLDWLVRHVSCIYEANQVWPCYDLPVSMSYLASGSRERMFIYRVLQIDYKNCIRVSFILWGVVKIAEGVC
jgi:hypothetical protein